MLLFKEKGLSFALSFAVCNVRNPGCRIFWKRSCEICEVLMASEYGEWTAKIGMVPKRLKIFTMISTSS